MFFMIPKEVHNMANRQKIGSVMSEVDQSSMMQDAYALKSQRKVGHVKPRIPSSNASLAWQPFILTIYDQRMLEMCEHLSCNNAWAIRLHHQDQ